ncbi:DUF2975 domain-containing protein [Domibacillus enclensis]|uniref:DUF2975 domain-containing protein n=1 Tax=Domibacillus enclensis TaxID=1017273 RepID=A0A1N6V258_9BACI|nr:DUF2975 domain-containing protein [Domibacillus enclensis]OXS78681.1 hypothetical protein B1B05_08800 [Domibacillus enclensis]SIQ71954.1 Protein of unknown function [Domibacillus enclensis]
MKKGTTFFLKLAVVFIGLPIVVLCLYLLPQLAIEAMSHLSDGPTLASIILGLLFIMYVTAIPYFNALYQAFKILTYIDTNEAFSPLSVTALRKIKKDAFFISGLYTLALPLIFMVAQWDDAPGLVLIGLVIVGASLVIGVFAAVLERLLQEAIAFKKENELTI